MQYKTWRARRLIFNIGYIHMKQTIFFRIAVEADECGWQKMSMVALMFLSLCQFVSLPLPRPLHIDTF